MRILHTECSTGLGGQELRIVSEAAGMAKRGHAVVLAVSPESALRGLAERRGLQVEPLAMSRRRFLPLIGELLALINRQAIQVVNTHGSLDSWTASVAGRLAGHKPVVIRTRHKSTPVSPTWRHRLLYGTLPHAVITTGEAVRRALVQGLGLEPARVVSIPTGVDLERFAPAKADPAVRRALGLSPGHFVAGTIAFLRGYKGVDALVEAAPLVVRGCDEARVLIVGDGPEGTRLDRQIEALGLKDHVRRAGFRDDVPALLAAVDVVVVPSRADEGLPQALSQAMAMERPVVATSVGAIPEVVEDGVTGLLVPPGDPQALARAILRLAGDPALRERLGRAARERIVQEHGLDRMLDRTEDLYESLLRDRSLSPCPN